jgi:tetratricopeptide (TPR) repeat protein
MTRSDRHRRKQLLREAEGYLDLLMVLEDRWAVDPEPRNRVAQRAIDALDRLRGTSPERGHALYLRGQALRVMECYAEAVLPLDEAARNDPENIHVLLALAWCRKRTGRLDLAIEALETALVADPSEGIIHYNLACYWSLAKNKQNAIEYLSQALAIDPNFRDLVDGERDFDPIRNDPDFLAITSVIV